MKAGGWRWGKSWERRLKSIAVVQEEKKKAWSTVVESIYKGEVNLRDIYKSAGYRLKVWGGREKSLGLFKQGDGVILEGENISTYTYYLNTYVLEENKFVVQNLGVTMI